MKIKQSRNGITLIREPGDKAISHESTITHHIRRLLNEKGYRKWVRFYPDRVGLTSCRQGVRTVDGENEVAYWHANYMIEEAHKAFNKGSVFYTKAE